MDKVGIKVLLNNDMAKCIKIIRKYCELSIGQIKDIISKNEYIIEGYYVDEKDISCIIKLYSELSKNQIAAELYEHDRKTDIKFLSNLVASYSEIEKELQDIIDQTVEN